MWHECPAGSLTEARSYRICYAPTIIQTYDTPSFLGLYHHLLGNFLIACGMNALPVALPKPGATESVAAFLHENKAVEKGDKLGKYVVNIKTLEDKTGIDFFCNLPDETEKKVENVDSEVIKKLWGLK